MITKVPTVKRIHKWFEKKKKCGRMFALYFVICRLLLGLFSVFGGLVGNKEHVRQEPECPPTRSAGAEQITTR